MPLFESFPYTDFEKLNLDWIIKQVKTNDERLLKLQDIFENKLADSIDQYVEDHLSTFLLNASYDAVTKTITIEEAQ